MCKHYVAGVGFVDPDWKQIEDLRKMLKEVVFQFEGLVQYESEEGYMDDELEAMFVTLLEDARRLLDGKAIKPPLGGTVISRLWKEDVKDLRNLLTSYGGHTGECMSHKDAKSWEYEYMCDCGWAMVEKVVRNG